MAQASGIEADHLSRLGGSSPPGARIRLRSLPHQGPWHSASADKVAFPDSRHLLPGTGQGFPQRSGATRHFRQRRRSILRSTGDQQLGLKLWAGSEQLAERSTRQRKIRLSEERDSSPAAGFVLVGQAWEQSTTNPLQLTMLLGSPLCSLFQSPQCQAAEQALGRQSYLGVAQANLTS